MANSTMTAMLNGSAGPPPPGVAPNLIDPSGIGLSGTILGLVIVIVTTIMLAIRVFTKLYLIKAWNLEDYLIILAWGFEIAYCVEAYLIGLHGGGLDIWDLRLADYLSQLHYLYIIAILYGPVVALIKVSILMQILTIFVPHRKLNMALWMTILSIISIIAVFYTIMTGFAIWECTPREKAWDPSLPGFCFDGNKGNQATGIFNIVSDFTVLVIPIWPVSQLHMRRGKKLAVISLFATGLFACIASIVRAYQSWILTKSSNFSHDLIILGCWAVAEIGVGIMICCLPIMPRFLQFLGIKLGLKSATTMTFQRTLGQTHTSNTECTATPPMTLSGIMNYDKEYTNNYTKTNSSIDVQYV